MIAADRPVDEVIVERVLDFVRTDGLWHDLAFDAEQLAAVAAVAQMAANKTLIYLDEHDALTTEAADAIFAWGEDDQAA